jgi:hypothetical protein
MAQTAGPSFTYQGKLTVTGVSASGHYDFLFTVFDDPTAGKQIGLQTPKGNVTITSGIFSVVLPGDSTVFPGDRRWLEISVRPTPPPIGPAQNYVTLPRQEITPSPYSITSLRAPGIPNGMQEFLKDGTFTVPPGVTRIMVDMIGGGGAGPGGCVRHILSVTPGEVLNVVVGASGIGGFPVDTNGDYAPLTAAGDSKLIRRAGQPDQTVLLWAGGSPAYPGGGAAFPVSVVDSNAMIQRPQGPPVINGPIGNDGTYFLDNDGSGGAPGYVLIQW